MSLQPLAEITNQEDAILQRVCLQLNDSCCEGVDREHLLHHLTSKLSKMNQFSKDTYRAMFQLKNQHFIKEFQLRKRIDEYQAYLTKQDQERAALIAEINRVQHQASSLDQQLTQQQTISSQLHSQMHKLISFLLEECANARTPLAEMPQLSEFEASLGSTLQPKQLAINKLVKSVGETRDLRCEIFGGDELVNLVEKVLLFQKEHKFNQALLKKQFNHCAECLAETETSLDAAHSRIAILEEQLHSGLSSEEKLLQENATLRERLNNSDKAMNEMKINLQQSQAAINQLRQQSQTTINQLREQSQAKIKQLEQLLKQEQSRVTQAQKSFSQLQQSALQERDQMQSESSTLEMQRQVLVQQIDDLKTSLESCQLELHEELQVRSQLEEQLKDSAEVYGNLQYVLRNVRAENQKGKQQLAKYQEEIKTKKEKFDQNKMEREKLKEQMQQLASENTNLKESNEKENSTLEQKCHQLKKNLIHLDKMMSQTMEEKEEQQRQHEQSTKSMVYRQFFLACRQISLSTNLLHYKQENSKLKEQAERRKAMIDVFNELVNWIISYLKGYDIVDGLIIMRKNSYLLRKGKDSMRTARYGECLSVKLKNFQAVERLVEQDQQCKEVVDSVRRVMRYYWE